MLKAGSEDPPMGTGRNRQCGTQWVAVKSPSLLNMGGPRRVVKTHSTPLITNIKQLSVNTRTRTHTP